jgi:hypothetical protein
VVVIGFHIKSSISVVSKLKSPGLSISFVGK